MSKTAKVLVPFIGGIALGIVLEKIIAHKKGGGCGCNCGCGDKCNCGGDCKCSCKGKDKCDSKGCGCEGKKEMVQETNN